MPDVYAKIHELDLKRQEQLADIIEMRAADPRHQAMLHTYLSEIQFPPASNVLEIGCGTGAVSRVVAKWPSVLKVTGVDPSPVFISKAAKLSSESPNAFFEIGDGRSLRFDDESFDVVIIHTTLSHVPEPGQLLSEAFRVLRWNGWISVFDGDYATATVALSKYDPLEQCIHAFRENFVHDPWLIRRLPELLTNSGFEICTTKNFGYAESQEAGYMLSWIERGGEVLMSAGSIGKQLLQGLIDEAKRRSTEKQWYAYIAFGCIIGRKRK